jgi:hypothetical protein
MDVPLRLAITQAKLAGVMAAQGRIACKLAEFATLEGQEAEFYAASWYQYEERRQKLATDVEKMARELEEQKKKQ